MHLNKLTTGMHPYSDEEILALIQNPAQKELGYRLFMRAHQERIYWVIRKIVGSHEDTDDVIQNTFLKAFRALGQFEARSSLYTWLHRIAVNEALAFRKSKMSEAMILPLENTQPQAEEEGADISAELIRKKLDHAVEALPEKQKEVFMLRYFEEMSYQEMADRLETSVGALKASYHFAVKKIESYIRNEG